MTTNLAWTTRLTQHSRAILVIGIAVAAATIGLWLYLPHKATLRAPVRVPSGQSAKIGTTTWTLKSLVATKTTTTSGRDSAVDGGSFVLATIDSDLTGYDPEQVCQVFLIAGEYRYEPMWSYTPEWSTSVPCSAPALKVAFEVPDRILAQIDGVSVEIGDRQPQLLVGRPPS
jgi:hypothetical protein